MGKSHWRVEWELRKSRFEDKVEEVFVLSIERFVHPLEPLISSRLTSLNNPVAVCGEGENPDRTIINAAFRLDPFKYDVGIYLDDCEIKERIERSKTPPKEMKIERVLIPQMLFARNEIMRRAFPEDEDGFPIRDIKRKHLRT